MKKITNPEAFRQYNLWRYKSLGHIPVIDIDQIEIRNNQPVAIIETTMFRYKHAIKPQLSKVLERIKFQMNIQQQIADKLNIPLYLVIHTEDLQYFLVIDYGSGKQKEMSLIEYKEFIKEI